MSKDRNSDAGTRYRNRVSPIHDCNWCDIGLKVKGGYDSKTESESLAAVFSRSWTISTFLLHLEGPGYFISNEFIGVIGLADPVDIRI